jgi:hypothetical protein
MKHDELIAGMLQSALKLAKESRYEFLCYLIEMAILHLRKDGPQKSGCKPSGG